MAQILSYHQVGIQFAKQLAIHAIQALGAGHELADQRVYFSRRKPMGNSRFNEHAALTRLKRKIALVAYAHNLVVEPKGKEYLGSRRQQGNDAHRTNLITLRNFLFVQEIFAPHLLERLEFPGPAGGDLLNANALLQLPHGLGTPKQQHKFCCVEVFWV